MTVTVILFTIAVSGLVWVLSFKTYELRTGRRLLLPVRWYAHDEEFRVRASSSLLAFSEWIGRAWGGCVFGARRAGVWVYRRATACVRYIENAVNKQYDLSKNGGASPYLREVAVHKTMIRNGTDENKPKHLDIGSEL